MLLKKGLVMNTMSKFFNPEDFYTEGELFTSKTPMQAANIANAKLEKEGIEVFSHSTDQRYWTNPNDSSTQYAPFESDIKAIVINIQPHKFKE